MKTVADLNALAETILDEIYYEPRKNVGYWETDDYGNVCYEDFKPNTFVFDEDGWHIEVKYGCCGEGTDTYLYRLEEICGGYTDDDQEWDFNEEDLKELSEIISEAFRNFD